MPASSSSVEPVLGRLGRRRCASIAAISSSRWATRSRLVANRGSSASSPTAAANFRHSPSDPTATCTGDGRGREHPVRRDRRVVGARRRPAPRRPSSHRGALEGVHADDPGQQRRADDAAAAGRVRARAAPPRRRTRGSSRPAGRRSARRPWSAARCRSPTSARPRPARSGRSRRGSASGPSWPKPVIEPITSRGLSSWSRSTGKPRRSSTPARKFSSSTSARRTSAASTSASSASLRSRTIDSLLRLADMKYVESSWWPVGLARPRRPPGPGVVAGGALDLDHPGAQVAEHHRRLRAGQGAGQVDHEDVGQGTGPLAHGRQPSRGVTSGPPGPAGIVASTSNRARSAR